MPARPRKQAKQANRRDNLPRLLLAAAILPVLAYALLDGLGWRVHAAVLVGGASAGATASGALYIVSHLLSVLVSPALCLTAAFYLLGQRLLSRLRLEPEVDPRAMDPQK